MPVFIQIGYVNSMQMKQMSDFEIFSRAQVSRDVKEQMLVDFVRICWQMNFMWSRLIQLMFLVLFAVVTLMTYELETVSLVVQADDWVENQLVLVVPARPAVFSF